VEQRREGTHDGTQGEEDEEGRSGGDFEVETPLRRSGGSL